MKKFWLIAAVCLITGLLGVMWDAATPQRLPQEVKTPNNPHEGRIQMLEARVKLLEDWAVRQGGKF